eukprot:Skav215428  [mRNA]  locus=scaffold745:182434:190295:- [translate_table: standard]
MLLVRYPKSSFQLSRLGICRALLKAGADVTMANGTGDTPLDLARRRKIDTSKGDWRQHEDQMLLLLQEAMEKRRCLNSGVWLTWQPWALKRGKELSPVQEKVREANKSGKYGPVPKRCVVTGGLGFVGQRLVETLVERGAEQVVSFDIVPPPANVWKHEAIKYVTGDLCDRAAVEEAVKGADCVWHNAAAVGPFLPKHFYHNEVDGVTEAWRCFVGWFALDGVGWCWVSDWLIGWLID